MAQGGFPWGGTGVPPTLSNSQLHCHPDEDVLPAANANDLLRGSREGWSTSPSWRFMGWGLSSIQALRGGEALLLHPQPRPSRCFLQSSIDGVPPVHPAFLTFPQCCSCGTFTLPGIVAPGRARTHCGWLVKQYPHKLQANKAWLTFRPQEPPLLCSKSLLFLSLCRWRDYFQANGALLGTLERWQVHHDQLPSGAG